MITNKYGTPKERLIKIALCILFILVIVLITGAGKRFYLSQYEETCYSYYINITYETHCRCTSYWQYLTMCGWECCNCPDSGKEFYNTSIINITDECIEYHLVRVK